MRSTLLAVAAGALLISSDAGLSQPSGGRAASSGVFTAAQAQRGAATYQAKCALCHGAALAGADTNPPLAGSRFLANWTGQSIADLSLRIRTTMPLNEPGSLGAAETADTIAFLLQSNGYGTGKNELPLSSSQQRLVSIDSPGSGQR